MRTYYRTLIQAEVESVGKYHPNAIYNIAQDLEDGPYVGTWSIKEYGVATAEQVEVLKLRKQNPGYKHYKHQHQGINPNLYTEDIPYYKTVIEIEVLTKEKYEVKGLVSLEYDMLSGYCFGVWSIKQYSTINLPHNKQYGTINLPHNTLDVHQESSVVRKPGTTYYIGHGVWGTSPSTSCLEVHKEEPIVSRYTGSVEIDYWNMDQDNYQDKVAFLTNHNKEELVAAIMSYHYNAFCKNHADAKDKDQDKRPSGKNIPYIGWFWRNVDFCGCVPIGSMEASDEGPGFIGFIGNNKWDYPERDLTDNERHQVICYLDRAMTQGRDGHREGVLRELWDYMQTLTIP